MAEAKTNESPRERSTREYNERMKGRPTPTQEECDKIKLGEHVELSDDGSGPDPNEALSTVQHVGESPEQKKRHAESHGGGAPYKTREATAGSAPKPHQAS
jgi:hypothetical protein